MNGIDRMLLSVPVYGTYYAYKQAKKADYNIKKGQAHLEASHSKSKKLFNEYAKVSGANVQAYAKRQPKASVDFRVVKQIPEENVVKPKSRFKPFSKPQEITITRQENGKDVIPNGVREVNFYNGNLILPRESTGTPAKPMFTYAETRNANAARQKLDAQINREDKLQAWYAPRFETNKQKLFEARINYIPLVGVIYNIGKAIQKSIQNANIKKENNKIVKTFNEMKELMQKPDPIDTTPSFTLNNDGVSIFGNKSELPAPKVEQPKVGKLEWLKSKFAKKETAKAESKDRESVKDTASVDSVLDDPALQEAPKPTLGEKIKAIWNRLTTKKVAPAPELAPVESAKPTLGQRIKEALNNLFSKKKQDIDPASLYLPYDAVQMS